MGRLKVHEIDQLFCEPIISIITTLNSDGTPHMTPVWHLIRGRSILVAVDEQSVKARNIKANPTVGLCIAANENPQRWALVNGHAVLTKDSVDEIVMTMALHYMPINEGKRYAENVLAKLNFEIIEITPTNIIGFDGIE